MSNLLEAQKELEQIAEDAKLKLNRLEQIEKEIKSSEEKLRYASNVVSEKMGDILDSEKFLSFFRRPYVIIPTKEKNRVLVGIPKFVKGFQVGWLWKETETYFVYQLDQYSVWLGEVPAELKEEIGFKQELSGTVQGNTLFFPPEFKENIKKKMREHVTDLGENQARIIRGHEFDVIAEMIENGCLPFRAAPVVKEDLREAGGKIQLRPYQKEAEKRFMETGAIGVFHPTGAGKSFIALYLIDVLKGPKVIIVPTRTLAEQWAYYIESQIPHCKNEVRIVTYQGFREMSDQYVLAVYDECQRLPADTFARLAVIRAKYRIGLSASPHREDGRESYIFALTGFPVGLNWKEYMETVGRSYHPINVHIVSSLEAKLRKLDGLLDMKKKTFIFCDTIELGKRIASRYSIPYIYGNTLDRLNVVQEHTVLAVSRVMDLGVSVKDLARIIEVDFLFGSRQQELQRTGRLMHSEISNVRHDIVMTDKELESYGKRLWALQEKGFTIKIRE